MASEVEEAGGLNAFLRTIPYNLYAILTIVMVFFISATGFDFGPMKKAEEKRREEGLAGGQEEASAAGRGTVPDLAVPILTLIVCSILGMAYVGGGFEGRPSGRIPRPGLPWAHLRRCWWQWPCIFPGS